MKALVLSEYNQFIYTDVAAPEPGPEDVLIRVRACAVCGSDVHGMDGSTGRRIPPVIMGHEASGEVVECGSAVTELSVGDRVTFDSTVYCKDCGNCAQGNVNLCANRQVLGVSCDEYRRNGALAEYLVVPAYICYKLPQQVTYIQAAMVEPLAIAYHAVRQAQIKPGMSALIVGMGTIGLLTLQVVQALGVREIIAVDIDPVQLDIARQNGATHVVNASDDDAIDQILSHTPDGRGTDLAFDATGIESTVNLCVRAVALNGQVVLVGNLAPEVTIPLQVVVTRQLKLYGSCASAGEYDECLRLIAEGRVDVDALISAVAPLKDGDAWIKRVYHREDGLTKIVFDIDGSDDHETQRNAQSS